MLPRPTARTISVRYSMMFIIIIGTLFLLSQILDNLFYDYTIVETEIVFIKRVDTQNNMEIELNEITETSNSLVEALRDNIKSTISQIQRRINIHYEEVRDILLQQANQQFKYNTNLVAYSQLLKSIDIEPITSFQDSIYILTVKNILNEQFQRSNVWLYSDHGTNFFDMAQTITLNNYWQMQLDISFDNQTIVHVVNDRNRLLFIAQDHIKQSTNIHILQNIQSQQNVHIDTITMGSQPIRLIAIHQNHILYSLEHDQQMFHHMQLIDGQWVEMNVTMQLESSSVGYMKPQQLIFVKDNGLDPVFAIVYLKIINDVFYLTGRLCKYEANKWESVYTFIDKNITDEIINGYQDVNNIQLDLLYDYNQEHNLMTFSILNKYLIFLRLKPWMFYHNNQKLPKVIKLYGFDIEEVRFKKMTYNSQDDTLYMLSEQKHSRFKMYLIDIKELEQSDSTDILKLRMPFFKPDLIVKDFQIRKNQFNNVVIFLFNNGEIAGIQKLNYGEGVLKKTFIVEMLDIILTLSFIGFFRYLKRFVQRVYSKLIQFCRKLL